MDCYTADKNPLKIVLAILLVVVQSVATIIVELFYFLIGVERRLDTLDHAVKGVGKPVSISYSPGGPDKWGVKVDNDVSLKVFDTTEKLISYLENYYDE